MRSCFLFLFVFAFLGTNIAQQADTPNNITTDTPSSADTEMLASNGKKKDKKEEPTEEQLNQQLFAKIAGGNIEEVEPLLNAMTYYKHNEEGETVLTTAINNEDIPMVKLLVEKAVINLKNKEGETPLTLAIKKGNIEIINLVAKRAKAGLKNDIGEAPLFLALQHYDNLHFLDKLVKKGANVNRPSNGQTPLILATQMNKIRQVAFLLKNDADVSQANEKGDTPLYIAVENGHQEIAAILAHKSTNSQKDVNWHNAIGEPLLNIATGLGHTQIVNILVDYGADVNAVDYMDNTALTLAAANGNKAVIETLVAAGADIDHQNILGATAIMSAAKNGHTDLAQFLAEQGANPEIRSYSGYNVSQYADYDAIIKKYQQTKSMDSVIEEVPLDYNYEE